MDKYVRIYQESDFDFQYKLDSAHVNMPFKFIFFTTDINRNFECTFDGETYVHCAKVDNDSIVFHIDGNTFGLGNLRIRKEYFIDSASFDDNICNSVDVEKTNIYIIEEGSNANSVVYEGSTLPNFDAVLIGERAEQALIEIDEKETELDDILGEAQLWEDRIENIEASYVSNEQLDDTLTSYATQTYVANYVSAYAPQPDLSAYVTKQELNNAGYITMGDVSACGYISSIPSEYITDNELTQILGSYVTDSELSNCGYITMGDVSACGYATESYVQNKINEIPQPDLSAYVTKVELNNAGYISSIPSEYITQAELSANAYLTQHQSLDAYATKSYVADYVATYAPAPDLSAYVTKTYANENYVTYSYLDEVVDEIVAGQIDLHDYVKKDELNQASYATQSYVADYVASHAPTPDLSAYVTKVELNNAGYISSIPSEYVTDTELALALGSYITYDELNDMSYVSQETLSNASYITMDDVSACGYITMDDVSACGYATETYVADYVAEHGGGGGGGGDYLPLSGGELIGKLDINNSSGNYSLKTKNHLFAGSSDKTGSTLIATQRSCNSQNNLAAFFTNSDGRAKFSHKTATHNYNDVTWESDDAFLIFNAYGFKIAYSGTPGTGASTEYDLIHSGNINDYVVNPDLSAYVTKDELNNASYATQSYVMDKINGIEPITYTTTYETTYENISIWQGTYAMYQSLPDYTSYQLYLIQQE